MAHVLNANSLAELSAGLFLREDQYKFYLFFNIILCFLGEYIGNK